jgi:hypothetical protein
LVLVFVAALAYYYLGTPVFDFIHRFVREFTSTFPV